MTTNLPYTLWGRPVKPLALGLVVTMTTLMVVNLGQIGGGVFGDSFAAHIVGAAALVAVVALVGGWVAKSERMADVGLLLAAGVWTVRSVFIALTLGVGSYQFWLNVSWVIMAGGSYLLEKADDGTLPRRRRRGV